MGIFSRRQKKSAIPSNKDLGKLLAQVAEHECDQLQGLWKLQLDHDSHQALFIELLIIYLSEIDRLAYRKLGDPQRSEFMNPIVDFCQNLAGVLTSLGATSRERELFFHETLMARFQKYGAYDSILAKGESSAVVPCSFQLLEVASVRDQMQDSVEHLPTTMLILADSMVALLSIKQVQQLV